MARTSHAAALPLTAVSGIGPARAEQLARVGVATVGELLLTAPRDYIDARRHALVRDLQVGRSVTVAGVVDSAGWRRSGRDRTLWVGSGLLRDDVGDTLQLLWFVKTPSGRRPRPLPPPDPNRRVIVSGVPRLTEDNGWQIQNADPVPADKPSLHAGRIIPVYALTEGITQKVMRRLVRAALDAFADRLTDIMPQRIVTDAGLPDISDALKQLHYPDDWQSLHRARQRLAFQELLLLRLSFTSWRRTTAAVQHRRLEEIDPAFLERLPFTLTAPQQRVLAEVRADLSRSRPMQRLLQGDVGSGKTVVVGYALARAAAAGGQAALVAPSEVLAQQHAETLDTWFAPDGISVELLLGATSPGARRRLLQRLAAGEPVVVVGTHALFEDTVRFRQLDVVVVDEQHRFGVNQRRVLLQSEQPPHVLVVSATPIPRTLAHCVYGDLDVSVLDEPPPGRLPVDTRWVRPARRDEVYQFLRRRVQAGAQAFVVFPFIGDEGAEADRDQQENLLQAAASLAQGPLAGIPTSLVHGRQTAADRAAAFERFRNGEAVVLLATTVIEVGVDVPRASVIVIEGADRFGLSQLHQLRGRVGRGGGAAHCFLVADPKTTNARRRLRILRETTDGFAVAQLDFALRGAGELFGVRQSGVPDLSPLGQSATAATLALVEVWAERLAAVAEHERIPEEAALWAEAERRSGGGDKLIMSGV